MNSMKMLQKSLKQRLVRGAKVVIGDNYGDPALRGKEMILASKSVVKCNGKGRCAHDNCVGLAAFVTEPGGLVVDKSGKKGDKSKNIGWRSGTTKICLTRLKTPEGDELVPDEDEAVTTAPSNGTGASHEPVNRVREHIERREETPSGSFRVPTTGETDTSWEALAQAANSNDHTEIVRIARALKRETEQLRQRLMDTQDRLLARMG